MKRPTFEGVDFNIDEHEDGRNEKLRKYLEWNIKQREIYENQVS